MPQLTVVVPLMDQADAFENTLASILRYSDHRIQLVVTHDGRYDDPHGILEEVESVIIPTHRNTSVLGRVAAAAEVCRAPWIHWVAPGIEATEGWCDDLLDYLARQPDLGLLSPRIFPAEEFHRDPQAVDCCASCILSRPNGHSLYLEDVYGEQWTLDQVAEDPSLAGPTGWAGFARRTLLEQWHQQWSDFRWPEGYAEQSLGLMVQADGWEHQVCESVLLASPDVCERLEKGIPTNGRAAAAIIGNFQQGSRLSKMGRSVVYAALETATAIFSPGNLQVAIGRLSHLGLAGTTARRSPATHEEILSMPGQDTESRPRRRRRAA